MELQVLSVAERARDAEERLEQLLSSSQQRAVSAHHQVRARDQHGLRWGMISHLRAAICMLRFVSMVLKWHCAWRTVTAVGGNPEFGWVSLMPCTK